MVAANQLYNAAAKDGTVIGMFGRGLYLEALFGNPQVKFEPAKFNWIGSHGREVSFLVTGKDTGFKTVADIRGREIILGASAPGADTHSFALVLRSLLDAKVKIVSGFPGQAEAFLALDRGEVHGNAGATIGTVMALRPAWLKETGPRQFRRAARHRTSSDDAAGRAAGHGFRQERHRSRRYGTGVCTARHRLCLRRTARRSGRSRGGAADRVLRAR